MDDELKKALEEYECDQATMAFMHTQYAGTDIPEEHITAEVVQLRQLLKSLEFEVARLAAIRVKALEGAIAELIPHIRTNDGHEAIYRLKIQGLIT